MKPTRARLSNPNFSRAESFLCPLLFIYKDVVKMTKQQKQIIAELRECGVPIPSIAEQLGISANTIKSYCQRHSILPLNKPRRNIRFCLQCQTEIPQTPHHKEKKFCCDKCRQLWWTGHSAIIQRSSQIKLTCPVCGRTFQSYESKHRKYCSRTCYGKSREVSHEK